MKVCESCTFQVVFVGAPNVSFPEYNEWETWKTCGNFVETLSKVGKSSLVRSISTGRPEAVQNTTMQRCGEFFFFSSLDVLTCWHLRWCRSTAILIPHDSSQLVLPTVWSWSSSKWCKAVSPCGINVHDLLRSFVAFHRWHTFVDSWTGCSKHGRNSIQFHISGIWIIWLFFWSVLIVKGQIVDSPGLKFGPGFGVRRLMFVCQRGILNWLWKMSGGNHNLMDKLTMGSELTWTENIDWKVWIDSIDWTEVPWRIFPPVWFSFLIPTPTPMGLLLRQTYANPMKIHEIFIFFSWNQCESCESCESEAFGCEWTSEASWVSQANQQIGFDKLPHDNFESQTSTLPSCQDSISSPAMAWRHQQDWHWRKGNQGEPFLREKTFDFWLRLLQFVQENISKLSRTEVKVLCLECLRRLATKDGIVSRCLAGDQE